MTSLFPKRDNSELDGGGNSLLGIAGSHPAALKRMKLMDEPPPVQNGVLSASQTPTIDEGRLIDISTVVHKTRNDQSMGTFFDSPNNRWNGEHGYMIADSVLKVLKNPNALEKELQNAVFTDLLVNHGIPFPETSRSSNETDENGNQKYSESILIKLLEELGKKMNQPETKNMQKIMRGLPVTTTSKPDLAPLDHRNGTFEIRLGELKNAGNYEEEQARTQCIMYLLSLLYWLRTVQGIPVESVYGFYICGCRCSDHDGLKYTVALVKLSAPQYLGDELKAVCLSQRRGIDNPLPLQLLVHFLKEGKRWVMADQIPRITDLHRRIPSLFVLPTSLWVDDQDRRLVEHGTLSVVFRITFRGLKDLLSGKKKPHHFRDVTSTREWNEYCDLVCEKSREHGEGVWFYLKIRSKNASWNTNPMGPMHDVWDLLTGNGDAHGFSWTYLGCPPFDARNFGLVVMVDRGLQIKQIACFEMATLAMQFSRVIDAALFLAEHLPHGDVLPHNIVYDEKKSVMTLIDIDEGVRKDSGLHHVDHILRRKNMYRGDSDDWYIALLYPNPLRELAVLYTQSQLIASFLFLMGKVESPTKQTTELHLSVFVKAKKLGERLYTLDSSGGEGSVIDQDEVAEYELLVKDAYDCMIATLGGVPSSDEA